MQTPLPVQAEWGSLTRTHERERNLESIAAVRDWLDGVEDYLRSGGDPAVEPRFLGHAVANVAGATDPDFEGVPMSTLRFWERWWSAPERTRHGPEEAGRDPQVEADKVRREIDAREAARS